MHSHTKNVNTLKYCGENKIITVVNLQTHSIYHNHGYNVRIDTKTDGTTNEKKHKEIQNTRAPNPYHKESTTTTTTESITARAHHLHTLNDRPYLFLPNKERRPPPNRCFRGLPVVPNSSTVAEDAMNGEPVDATSGE